MRRWLLAGLTVMAFIAVAPVAGACTLASTNATVTRTLGARTYALNVPAGLTAAKVPLLLSLHGFGSTGQQDELSTGWSGFAARHGFIVAYPQGRGSQYSGAWDPYSAASPDVGFLQAVAADISATYCVDQQRMHVDGWSNGAVMSQRTACDAAGTFASVTSYAGGTPTFGGPTAPCTPSRPTAIGLIAGQEDFTSPALAGNAQDWRTRNGCGAATHTTDTYGSTDTYSCAAGTHVFARTVGWTSHNWPSGAAGEDQRTRMWAFFSAHPRP